jgi:hypothetical protein
MWGVWKDTPEKRFFPADTDTGKMIVQTTNANEEVKYVTSKVTFLSIK